ncbi:zinc finger protein 572 [Chelydra serpentina]|uniref:Zinc finger protein 572 n=1 Tax=Chelydra serpentina TaxID=8475 RepID=A0A8T1S457_CHESE|nr:zinc finger protein 572 [Chelydra serpentina]
MASLIRRPATEPYKCHDCGQSFAEGSGLSRHLASHPKPFRCPECGRGFPDTGALARHREVHAGGEPAGPGEKSRKSCAEISAVLLRQGNHVAGRGPRSRAADDALPPGASAPARPPPAALARHPAARPRPPTGTGGCLWRVRSVAKAPRGAPCSYSTSRTTWGTGCEAPEDTRQVHS